MSKTPMKASDPNDLERRILDPNVAKSEAEWWAKSRIEELEREVERLNRIKSRTHQVELQAENDALLAHIARLHKALEWAKEYNYNPFEPDNQCNGYKMLCATLAATPAQSLARLRNQVREECEAVVCRERDALIADIARLRELLADCQDMFDPDAGSSHVHHKLTVLDIRNALAATPEQSLARLRNQVKEECAKVCDYHGDDDNGYGCAAAIRAMKEPE